MTSSPRNTQVHVLDCQKGWYAHIVVSPVTEKVTLVFTIDKSNGNVYFSSTPFVDVFKSHRQACDSIISRFQSHHLNQGKALIGATIESGRLLIALVKSSRTAATLPNGNVIKSLEEAEFVTIPLKGCETNPGKLTVTDFALNGKHFYCEFGDITRPYPSPCAVSDYDNEFCWNERWRNPFVSCGVPSACIVLLQGYCGSCNSAIYMVRRSVLNPYTRYTSRGLDDGGAPGNEVECELIFKKDDGKFMSNCWRRGSVPIKWATVVRLRAMHVVSSDSDPKTAKYFERVSKRFGNVPVQIISLLDRSENEGKLRDAYNAAVSELDFVQFMDFNLAEIPETMVVRVAEDFLRPVAENAGFNTENEKQRLLPRFNCADSIDRTNVATFCYARALARLQNVKPEVEDWLTEAFVKSGDILSLIYTNTTASRSQVIRSMTSGMSHAKSDTAIGVWRRVTHYVTDGEKDKMIGFWISHTNTPNGFFSMDEMHLSTVCHAKSIEKGWHSANESIFRLDTTVAELDTSTFENEIVIKFPQPLLVCVLRIHVLPSVKGIGIPRSFTMSCGNDVNSRRVWLKDIQIPEVKDPTLFRYSLSHRHRWNLQVPYEGNTMKPGTFLRLTFSSEMPSISIGNISLDCYIPKRYLDTSITEKATDSEVDDYRRQVLRFLGKSKPSLCDYMEIELTRMRDHISIAQRNRILVEMGFNPIVVEPRNHLRRKNGECCFCGAPLKTSVLLEPHRTLKSILEPRPTVFASETTYDFCPTCADNVKICEPMIRELESQRIITREPISFRAPRWGPEDLEGTVKVSVGPSAVFLEYPKNGEGDINSTLVESGSGWTLRNANQAALVFTLCLNSTASVEALKLTFSGEVPNNVVLLGHDVVQNLTLEGESVVIKPEKPIITNVIAFQIEAASDVLTLSRVVCLGVFVERPVLEAKWYKFPNLMFNVKANPCFTWDCAAQTSIYQLQVRSKLRRVIFRVVEYAGQTQPQALIIGFYDRGKLEKSVPLLIPQHNMCDGELSFRIVDAPFATVIKIFYLDVVEKLKPFETRFMFDNTLTMPVIPSEIARYSH